MRSLRLAGARRRVGYEYRRHKHGLVEGKAAARAAVLGPLHDACG